VEIAIGGVDGIRLGGELGEVSPSSKVVALTSVARPVVVRRAMAAGFHGFLTKDTSAEGFQRSVRAILDGRLVFPGRPRKVVAHPGGASANGHGDGHGNGSGNGSGNGNAGRSGDGSAEGLWDMEGVSDGHRNAPSAEELLGSQLTDREREVLALLTKGSTSLAIARTLQVSPNTVRTHVQSIRYKLQVHSRLEAAAFAVRHGLVPVE
jgi:DNA-binding NarL/FixJ family response regulator